VGTFSFPLELGRYFCDNDVQQLECLVFVASKLYADLIFALIKLLFCTYNNVSVVNSGFGH
jgi:hypothetical protein